MFSLCQGTFLLYALLSNQAFTYFHKCFFFSKRIDVCKFRLALYYRKRGSASYIVREVHSVRERERERERERRK